MAFGMSAISQADGVYWQNIKDLPGYYEALDSGWEPFAKGYILSSDDKIRRHTIMRLMCDLSLDYAALSKDLGIDFAAYFAAELDSMADLEQDGLLQRGAGGLVVNEVASWSSTTAGSSPTGRRASSRPAPAGPASR